MAQIRWLGAAGLELTHDGVTTLFDPYLSRPSFWRVAFAKLEPDASAVERYLAEIPGALSSIVVGHTHLDHALDVPALASRFDGPIVGSPCLAHLLELAGHAGRVTIPGDLPLDLPGGVRLTMLPSLHGYAIFGRIPYPGTIDPKARLPMRAFGYRHGRVYMPKFEVGGVTVVVAGSANLIETALQGQRCDVLFMAEPGWQHVPAYTTRLLEILRPKLIVPFHYDDFMSPIRREGPVKPLFVSSLPQFLKRLAEVAGQAQVRLLRPFEVLEI